MTSIGDDLFASYRRYKGMDVDSPQYEPLEYEVVSKDDIKKLKAKEYAEKNKDKLKIKRLQKIVDNLRAENKTLKENQQQVRLPDDRQELEMRISELEESNTALIRERDRKREEWEDENKALIREIDNRERDFEEFRNAVKIIMKYF